MYRSHPACMNACTCVFHHRNSDLSDSRHTREPLIVEMPSTSTYWPTCAGKVWRSEGRMTLRVFNRMLPFAIEPFPFNSKATKTHNLATAGQKYKC